MNPDQNQSTPAHSHTIIKDGRRVCLYCGKSIAINQYPELSHDESFAAFVKDSEEFTQEHQDCVKPDLD